MILCWIRLYAQPSHNLRKTYECDKFHKKPLTLVLIGLSTDYMPSDKITHMSRRTALQLMVLCLLVAAALRLPKLTEIPPGLHYDEAANGLLAQEIGLGGERPIFIASYTGKETLFFYLAGGLMRVSGPSVFTLRLTSAYLGLLTVAVTFWMGTELLGDRRIAIVAAALIAISFWQVLFSRLGFRAISQPLLQAITVAALFRGLRKDSWPWLIFSGITMGLTGYTYLAARIFPIPLALAMLPLLVGRYRRPRRWRQLLLVLGLSLVVLAPLFIYFIRQPDAFWVRIGQVGPENTSLVALAGSYGQTLGMFFMAGDPYWRFNIPGRPLFNWLWGGLMVVGWLYLLLRYRHQDNSRRRAAFLLLLLMPLFMLLPTALAIGDIIPSNLRAIGVAPFIFFLPAIGFVVLLDAFLRWARGLVQRWGTNDPRLYALNQLTSRTTLILVMAVLLLLILGSLTTARAYFQEWATREDVFYDSDADLVQVARYLEESQMIDGTVFLAAQHFRHPTVAFLSDQYERLKWLPDSQALVFPAEGPATYLYPYNSPLPDWASEFMPTDPRFEGPKGPNGQPTFLLYRQSQPTAPAPPNQVNANFGNQVTLLGYEASSAAAGAQLPVTLYWRVEQPATANYTPFIHLEDAWGYRWSQQETFAYPAEQWSVGDTVVQRVEVPLPIGMPPAAYKLRVGFFDPDSGDQLARLDNAGRYAGNAQVINNVQVLVGPFPKQMPEPDNTLNLPVNANLTLLGYSMGQDKVLSGAPFDLNIWWEATDPLPPMTSRLELVGSDNVARILLNTQPVYGTYPFDSWTTPQLVIDRQILRVPATVPPGEFIVSLRLLDAAEETLLTADLGSLVVEGAGRLFTPPSRQFPLSATFGEEILLLGYDLAKRGSGQFDLSLVWQALAEPNDSYAVFVHVLDQDGRCCVWQQDLAPQQGTYPTNQWITDEVVVDEYLIDLPADLPPGSYPVEIGLYLPETGQRLLVRMPGLRDNDTLLLRPLQVE